MPPFHPKPSGSPAHSQQGHTLVELMVASSLLGVAVTGVMSMLGTGREIEGATYIRQQAVVFASSVLEDPIYNQDNYPIPTAAFAPRLDTLRHSTRDTVLAVETRTVSVPQTDVEFTDFKVTTSTIVVPYQRITVKLKWALLGKADSVVLVKRVAQIK